MNALRLTRTASRFSPKMAVRTFAGDAKSSGPQHIHKHPVSVHVAFLTLYWDAPIISSNFVFY